MDQNRELVDSLPASWSNDVQRVPFTEYWTPRPTPNSFRPHLEFVFHEHRIWTGNSYIQSISSVVVSNNNSLSELNWYVDRIGRNESDSSMVWSRRSIGNLLVWILYSKPGRCHSNKRGGLDWSPPCTNPEPYNCLYCHVPSPVVNFQADLNSYCVNFSDAGRETSFMIVRTERIPQ